MFLDLTFGAGGHTKGLLNRNPQSIMYALDRDQYAIELARQLAKEYPCEKSPFFTSMKSTKFSLHRNRLFPHHGQFSDLKKIFHDRKNFFDGILLDAGTR